VRQQTLAVLTARVCPFASTERHHHMGRSSLRLAEDLLHPELEREARTRTGLFRPERVRNG
ncbi:MAG: hypothetical protein ONB07_06640, partial [candidate division KSB1 bacterium]|nr:hypothetical protein [candidate division KSB1 bacterium]